MTENTMKKPPVMLYTEQTPNPETLKFVTNQMLYPREMIDFKETQKELAAEWSPLASALFEFDYVKGVYICNNFVTVTKTPETEWATIMLELKNFLKNYVQEGKEVVKPGYEQVQQEEESKDDEIKYDEKDAALVVKIKQILDKYVRPAVEMDGGNIKFHSFKEGVVSVVMQGSCSGCPSSSVTLKSGIEGMLKRMVPEVTEVVAIMG
jgi:Fe-S cluster biogenesis protein NfuA